MTIAVTGATGFLGSALVTELVQRKQSVCILARDSNKARQLFGDVVTIVPGAITDLASVQQAIDGAQTVYHLAGCLYHPSIPAELYQRTHVEGTHVLLKACQGQARLRRVVHISTTGVYGVTGETPAAEDAPFAPTNPYEASKLAAEQMALACAAEQGLPVTVIRPGLVYGPGDLHLLGFFRAIHKGLFRVIAGGEALLHPVYIDDLVAALLLSAEQPQAPGRAYNIAGRLPVSVRKLAAAIAQTLDRRLPAGSIPLWLANLASDVFAILPGMKGEHAPLTRSRVLFLTNSRVYDISRAKAELGYVPRIELEEGLGMAAAWYCKHGYLK